MTSPSFTTGGTGGGGASGTSSYPAPSPSPTRQLISNFISPPSPSPKVFSGNTPTLSGSNSGFGSGSGLGSGSNQSIEKSGIQSVGSGAISQILSMSQTQAVKIGAKNRAHKNIMNRIGNSSLENALKNSGTGLRFSLLKKEGIKIDTTPILTNNSVGKARGKIKWF